MSMSTGDVRRPNTKLSAKAAATDKPEVEVVDDAPEGGVLPVKKAARTGSGTGSGAKATGTKAAGAAGTKAAGATGAKAAGASGAKAAGAKTTPVKAAKITTKVAGTKT